MLSLQCRLTNRTARNSDEKENTALMANYPTERPMADLVICNVIIRFPFGQKIITLQFSNKEIYVNIKGLCFWFFDYIKTIV